MAVIIEFISSIIGLVASIVTSTLQFFLMIPSWITMLTSTVALIPGVLFPFAMLGIYITLLLLILGRLL